VAEGSASAPRPRAATTTTIQLLHLTTVISPPVCELKHAAPAGGAAIDRDD
jgi:hypothetical protein